MNVTSQVMIGLLDYINYLHEYSTKNRGVKDGVSLVTNYIQKI